MLTHATIMATEAPDAMELVGGPKGRQRIAGGERTGEPPEQCSFYPEPRRGDGESATQAVAGSLSPLRGSLSYGILFRGFPFGHPRLCATGPSGLTQGGSFALRVILLNSCTTLRRQAALVLAIAFSSSQFPDDNGGQVIGLGQAGGPVGDGVVEAGDHLAGGQVASGAQQVEDSRDAELLAGVIGTQPA